MTTTKVAIQVRRDTATNWSTNNPVPKSGEWCFETDTGKVKIGNGSSAYNSLGYIALNTDVVEALKGLQMANHLYAGEDLATKFASEISGYTDIYAWLKARIYANNFTGIRIGDYFTYSQTAQSITDGNTTIALPAKTMTAKVMGIDTYYQYGDGGHEVPHHIDFITTSSIGVNIQWNPNDNNNGTADQQIPWLASKIYACLNGVDNYSTNAYNSVAHGYAITNSSGSVLASMPANLQSAIKTKRMYLPKRYSANGLLTSSPAGDWCDMGKLWLPTEQEVYGAPIHSADKATDGSGLDFGTMGSPVQYPLFAGTAGDRNKKLLGRVIWWLASVPSGSSARACSVGNFGHANASSCTGTWYSAPVCFRITA